MALDVNLQQCGGMISRPSGGFRFDAIEAQLPEIEFVNKCINHPDRIVLFDPVIQPVWEQ